MLIGAVKLKLANDKELKAVVKRVMLSLSHADKESTKEIRVISLRIHISNQMHYNLIQLIPSRTNKK